MPRAFASAPGSVGELLQGFNGTGEAFHVTLPASWGARVRATVTRSSTWTVDGPAGRKKMLTAGLLAARTISRHPLSVTLDQHANPIPVGAGCASSTADTLAAIRAVAAAYGTPLPHEKQSRLCSAVESSDGLAYPGMAAVNHKTGRLLRTLPWTPPFEIVALIPPTVRETTAVDFDGKSALGPKFDWLLDLVSEASAARDPRTIASAATESAILNQQWNENPLLPPLLELADGTGAAGVAVAHTGTTAALLFLPGQHHLADEMAVAAATLTPAGGMTVRLQTPTRSTGRRRSSRTQEQ